MQTYNVYYTSCSKEKRLTCHIRKFINVANPAPNHYDLIKSEPLFDISSISAKIHSSILFSYVLCLFGLVLVSFFVGLTSGVSLVIFTVKLF